MSCLLGKRLVNVSSVTVKRMDRGELRSPEKRPNGWVRFDGFISRTGIQEYTQADGQVWREFRPPEEVFNKDTLESFALVPLTNDHPASGFLDASNTKAYQVGTVEIPLRDGDLTRARMMVTDARAVEAVFSGKAELSCGYSCELDHTPGEYNGQRYDAVQRNIRGNHVAIVAAGRAGPAVRLRVDSKDIADRVDIEEGAMYDVKPKEPTRMATLRIDELEHEVSETVAQAFKKYDASVSAELAKAKEEAEKASARADASEAQVKELKSQLEAAPAKVKAEVAARAQLEVQASKILGKETNITDKSDFEIRCMVAEKVNGIKLDGKSEAYVNAAFDLAVERHTQDGEKLRVLPSQKADTKEAVPSAVEKYQKYLLTAAKVKE